MRSGAWRRRNYPAVGVVILVMAGVVAVDVARNHAAAPAGFLDVPPEASAPRVARAEVAAPVAATLPIRAPTTTTSTAPHPGPTTTTSAVATVALPVPHPLPRDPYEDTPDEVIGRIAVPAIGVDQALQSGMSLTAINRGPSHWPGTAMPGQLGNVVIAGHRTTYTRPFGALDRLVAGDHVVYTTPAGLFTYAVTGVEVVEPDALDIADQTAAYTATLFACHPPGSARFRIVVRLAMLDAAGEPVPAPTVTVSNQAAITAFRA